ncbi:hypothetical protein JL720_13774 [Aureococcus anophagefferens]|nr:hypothetical protein JL720_13774 [Aureococcus anophagefferens]
MKSVGRAETVNELARRPSRDEVERLVATAGVGAAGDDVARCSGPRRRRAKLGEDLAAAQAAQTTEAASLARVAAEKVAEELNERVDGLEATCAAAADVEDAQRALEAALREDAAALAAVAKTAAEGRAAVPKKQADRSDDDDDAVEAAGESERKAFARDREDARLSHRDKETRLRAGSTSASATPRDALAVAESLRGTVAACDAKLSVALKDSSSTSAERAKLASDVAVAQRRLEDYGKRSVGARRRPREVQAVRHVAARAAAAKQAATNVAEDVAAEKRRAQDDKLLKEAEASSLGDAKFSSWPRASRPSSAAAGPRASPPRPPRTRARAAAAAADISKRGKKRGRGPPQVRALVQGVAPR